MRFRRRCYLIRYPFGDDRWQGDAAPNETEAMSQTPSLAQLQPADAFLRRHLGPDPAEQQAMLDFLGVSTRAELIVQTVPPAIRLNRPLELPAALDEQAALARLRGYAGLNQRWTSLIGMGYYGTVTPSVILRNVLENPGWYTAYTPYQPEIAQGRLEALLNFQQLTIDLTGLDLASASLLDEATAAAEAMALARRVAKARSSRFFVDAHCHPQTVSVLRTRAEAFGFELVVDEPDNLAAHAVFGALLQYPDSRGEIRDLRPLIEALHGQQALACVASDLLALLLLTPPGNSVPTWCSAAPSALAYRWATAGRTRRSSPPAKGTSGQCRGGSSAFPATPAATRRCAWPCKPASSTSVGKRPTRTSAPPRCCWPTLLRCMPSTMGHRS